MQDAALTLIIPCYNSARFIHRSFAEIERCLLSMPQSRVLFVDDASSDQTHAILADLIRVSPVAARMTVLSNPVNSGKGAAIARGLEAVTTGLACYTDADLAYDIANIEAFLPEARAGRIIVANRVHHDSVYLIRPHYFRHIASRHLASRILNSVIAALLIRGIEDAQAGLKLATTADLRECMRHLTCWRFSFDTELLTVACIRGMEIVQMPVRFRYDPESSTVRFFRDSVDMALALARIWVRKMLGRYQH